jgi:hypothetical protein
VLTDKGLSAALEALVERVPVAVEPVVLAGLEQVIEEPTVYLFVSEALTKRDD